MDILDAILEWLPQFTKGGMKHLKLIPYLVALLAMVTACSTPAPMAAPTPDIDATVAAAIQAAREAVPAATSNPTAAISPTTTTRPTQDLPATITAAVQSAIAALPTVTVLPTATPTPASTQATTPTATTEPTSTPIPPTPTSLPPEALKSMIEKVRAGVVRIEISRPISPYATAKVTGSGVIFEKEANWGAAFVLTNFHVIEEVIADADANISVTVNDLKAYTATVVGIDIKRDLAVLKIYCQRFNALSFRDAANVEIGEPVITVGLPLGSEAQQQQPEVSFPVSVSKLTMTAVLYKQTPPSIRAIAADPCCRWLEKSSE